MSKSNNKLSTSLLGIIGLFCFIISNSFWLSYSYIFSFIAFSLILSYLKKSTIKNGYSLWWISFFTSLIIFYWLYGVLSFGQYLLLSIIYSIVYIIPFLLFLKYKKALMFALCWITIEYTLATLNPMNNLGLSLTQQPELIQWYSYTGSFGGTFWILMINVMLYNFIICKSFNSLLYLSSIIVIPITISFVIKNNVSNYKSISANFQIVAINTKFSGSLKYKETESSLLKQQIKLSYLCIDTSENTLIVWPESSITSKIKTTKIKESYAYKILNARLIKNNSSLISGTILSNNNHTYTGSVFFKKDSTSFRVKEKLVPFNEYYPIPNSPKWMKNILYTGVFEFSTYQNNKAFISKDINIGSLICFESFFGNFVRKLIDSNNIEIIVIGLNEGWYKKKGYKLAEAHAVSRSIENRKPIIKSSNEGFTTYINYYGKIVKTIKNEGCINIIPSFIKKTTFYQKNGDWLPILSIVFLIISLSVTFIKNFLIKDY